MFSQLLLGSVITVISLMVGAIFWGILKRLIGKVEPWLRRSDHGFRTFVVVLLMVAFFMMSATTFGVWMWALVFLETAAFSTLEEALYYSLVAYTTLGVGDVILPQSQRLLGGMTGANGFFMFGLMTAMLTDTLRHIGKVQRGMED